MIKMMQPIQFALPGVQPVRLSSAIETAVAVPRANQGEQSRNDLSGDRGSEAERLARDAWARLTDPRAPVGPPPSFQANVLEAERERLKQPQTPVEKSQAADKDRKADADTRELQSTPPEAYVGLEDEPAAEVDVAF